MFSLPPKSNENKWTIHHTSVTFVLNLTPICVHNYKTCGKRDKKKTFQIIKRDRKIHHASAFSREYMSNFMLFMMQQGYYLNAN
jgi:hypothetical protein